MCYDTDEQRVVVAHKSLHSFHYTHHAEPNATDDRPSQSISTF